MHGDGRPDQRLLRAGATYDINAPVGGAASDPPEQLHGRADTILKMVFSKPLNPIFVNNVTFGTSMTPGSGYRSR